MAKVNISIPDELLEQVDALAEELHTSRSGLIQEASAHYVTSTRAEQARIERERNITEAIRIAQELSEQIDPFDVVSTIRSDRDRDGRKIGE